jgi:hypothetical protein
MTQRTPWEQRERQEWHWEIVMVGCGARADGVGWTSLLGYMRDCYERGVDFRIVLTSLEDKALEETARREEEEYLEDERTN